MKYIIYKTTNLITGKYYIGQHKQEQLEFDGYFGSGTILKEAIDFYGKENFIRETLEICTIENVNEKEIYWINTLNSTNTNIGYNLSTGGCCCNSKRKPDNDRLSVRLDEETKKEMIEFANQNDVSLGWIVRRSWIEFKESVKKGIIKLYVEERII